MTYSWKQCLAALAAIAAGVAWSAEATPPGNKPLVANEELSLSTLDFDAYMERVPAARRDEFRAEYEKINPTVDGLWIRRVLAARAVAAGMDKDPLIAARLKQVQEDLLAQVYLADLGRKTPMPNLDARAREIYKVNAKEFTKPQLISGTHILVSIKTHSREEAMARARQIYQRAKAGEDFQKLADETTDSPPTRDIVDQPLSVFEKPLPDILARMSPGDVMEPVETRYGVHIIKLTGRSPPRMMPFDEVKDDIIAMEKQKIIDDAKTAATEAIRSDPKTTVYVENVRALKSDFKVPEEAIRKSLNPEAR